MQKLRVSNENLIGKRRQYEHELQQDCINLPNSVEVCYFFISIASCCLSCFDFSIFHGFFSELWRNVTRYYSSTLKSSSSWKASRRTREKSSKVSAISLTSKTLPCVPKQSGASALFALNWLSYANRRVCHRLHLHYAYSNGRTCGHDQTKAILASYSCHHCSYAYSVSSCSTV